jgi:hypothetical protein
VWGKPGLNILCDDGHEPERMTSPDGEEGEGGDEGENDMGLTAAA